MTSRLRRDALIKHKYAKKAFSGNFCVTQLTLSVLRGPYTALHGLSQFTDSYLMEERNGKGIQRDTPVGVERLAQANGDSGALLQVVAGICMARRPDSGGRTPGQSTCP